MNCRYCGTELPLGALFCGECGRAVTADQARIAYLAGTPVPPSASPIPIGVGSSIGTSTTGTATALAESDDDEWDEELPAAASVGFSIADLADDPQVHDTSGDGADAGAPSAEASAVPSLCPQCGATVDADDVFCGECGFVLRTVQPAAAEVPDGAVPADATPDLVGETAGAPTSIIVLPDLIHLGAFPVDPDAPVVGSDHGDPVLDAPAPDAPVLDAPVAAAEMADVPADAEPADPIPDVVPADADVTTEVEPLPAEESVTPTPIPLVEPAAPGAPIAFGALDALPATEADVPATDDDESPAGQSPDAHTSAEEPPAEAAPAEAAPAEEERAEETPAGEQPAEQQPAEETPVEELVHESPAHVAASAAAAAAAAEQAELEFDEPLPFALPIAKPNPSTRSRPIPDPFPWGTDSPLREDIEATRLIADMGSGTRFVLQFSTGESVTVLGSGLVGRNPAMQPGEFVDQLVPIFDAGKSVSKTHLEFGQEGGRFWVSDRYSTNGSTIRQPDAEPRRADPGRRYFVARGTRVDLGEQFFVVS